MFWYENGIEMVYKRYNEVNKKNQDQNENENYSNEADENNDLNVQSDVEEMKMGKKMVSVKQKDHMVDTVKVVQQE